MRKLLAGVIAAGLLIFSAPEARAKSSLNEFTAAWVAREAQYRDQHGTLDQNARAAIQAYETAIANNSPDSGQNLHRMLGAIQAASFTDGRGQALNALRAFMGRRPSNLQIELWMQERGDEMRIEASGIAANLRGLNEARPEEKSTGAFMQRTVTALAQNATFQGKLAEMRLIDSNLGTYFRAKTAEDDERRLARQRIFAAIGSSLSQWASQPGTSAQPGWTVHCDRFGNQVSCRGQ